MKQLYLVILSLIYVCISSAQTYSIGDVYTAPDGSQGIVYYLNPEGTGGWVVALTDASSESAWGEDIDIPQLTNVNVDYAGLYMADTNGSANTQIIRAFQNNSSYAAGRVDIAHGWFLPTVRQLRVLCSQLAFVTTPMLNAGGAAMAEDYYWSSVEYSNDKAWTVNFGAVGSMGEVASVSKVNAYHVRAVRSFSYATELPADIGFLWNTGATTYAITESPLQTTTYTVTISDANGFSETVSKTITVGGSLPGEFSVETSEPYVWAGVTYSESGDYTRVFPAADGCDSVVTLHLTSLIAPELLLTATDSTICVGNEVTLQAEILNAASVIVIPDPPTVSLGDILCTDNSIVKPTDWPEEGKTAMAVVFFVDDSGEHGWALHLDDQATAISLQFASSYVDVPELTNYSTSREAAFDTSGYVNTQIIRNTGGYSLFPAAWMVDYNNGWYLPAAGQLNILFSNVYPINASLQAVGATLIPMSSGGFIYWSSTEKNSNSSWVVTNHGTFESVDKQGNYHSKIRSVRNF